MAKLGAYVGQQNAEADKLKDAFLEELAGGPCVNVLFTALVHRVPHFRYSLTGGEVIVSPHTPVVLNRSYQGKSVSYCVDIIAQAGLADAVACIEASFTQVVERIVPYMLAV